MSDHPDSDRRAGDRPADDGRGEVGPEDARPRRRPRPPVFLAPDRYRRRRLMDGARMLPMAGAFLLLLPMLWRSPTQGQSTATEGLYLFGVWALLILVAGLLARPLLAAEGEPGSGPDDDHPDGGGDGGG